MPSGNLQIMTENLSNTSVLSATSEQANYPLDNIQLSQLSSKWRSVDATDQSILVTFNDFDTVSGFSLNGINTTYGSTVRLQLYQTIANLTVSGVVDNGATKTFTFVEDHLIPNNGFVYGLILTSEVTPADPVTDVYDAVYAGGKSLEVTTGVDVTAVFTEVASLRVVLDNTVDGIPQVYGWGEQPWGRGRWYGYDDAVGRDFVTMWFADTIADRAKVTISDPSNLDGYIEVGRMWMGNSFSPEFNMSWGMEIDYRSDTKVTRTRSGSIISDNRPSYRVAKFSFQFLNEAEGMEVLQMFNYPSNKSDALLAMYPDNNSTLEQETVILGRITNHSALGRQKIGYSASFDFVESL